MASYFNLALDTTAPAGVAISIDGGAAYTTARAVTAGIATSDGDTTGYQMKIWGDVDLAADANIQDTEAASSWIAFSAAQAVMLSAGDGAKTLNVKVRDDVGNASAAASDAITLDTTVPTATITVAAAPTKISKVAAFDTTAFQFQSDVAIQAWEVRVVPAAGSDHTAGAVIPTAGGSANTSGGALAAATNQGVTIKGADLEAASAGDGTKIVKVFVQDEAGNWSL